MRTKLFLTLLSVLFLVGIVIDAGQGSVPLNIVVNGGFEEPLVTVEKNWNIFSSEEIPGWCVEWVPGPETYGDYSRPEDAFIELQKNGVPNGCTAAEGVQWAELDSDWDGPTGIINGEPASIKICQSLTTVPGEEYELRFCFSPRPNTDALDNVLVVRWDGTDVDTISLAGGDGECEWTEYSYNLIATGCTTELEFADGGISNSLGTFLDDVRVFGPTGPEHVIPEPPIIVCTLLMFMVLAIFLMVKKNRLGYVTKN